ncbi:MAG TPA: hypothetical protein VFE08_05620 [Candidatus Sulfotelmatobacter sp.]|jgi:hypothetical protein|nr:hypothetical protein [Candidatus Sulfotelmatobacter sp.]
MGKADTIFLTFPVEQICSDRPLGKACSTSSRQIKDKRLSRLLVVLRQLNESLPGLEVLPETDVSEIVFAALRVCGYVEPMEALEVIAAVLEAIETQDPIPESLPLPAMPPR